MGKSHHCCCLGAQSLTVPSFGSLGMHRGGVVSLVFAVIGIVVNEAAGNTVVVDDSRWWMMGMAYQCEGQDVGDMGAHHGHCCGSLPLSSLWVLLLVVISNCAGGGSRWEVCTRS